MPTRITPSTAPNPDGQAAQSETTPAGSGEAARPTLRGLLWPLGVLTAGLVAIIVVLLLFAAREQNGLALQSSLHLAESALGDQINELKSTARDYATWDETVEEVVQSLDETWADDNIGTWAYEGLQMSGTLVLDGGGRVLYGMIGGERLGEEILTRITEGLLPLAAAARKADPGELGVALAGNVRFDGGLAIAAAAPIVFEGGSPAHDAGGAASVLIFFRLLDRDLLTRLEDGFLLPGLHLAEQAAVSGASLALPGYDGTVLGHLAWTAEQPGFVMLQPLLLPGALAGLLGLLLLWIVVRRIARALQELEDSHTALHQQAVELSAARDRALQQTRTETELRRNAVAASRAKSDFLALVSHELRTPLNAILGFSETIATQAFGRDAGERYREYAEDIHESGSHLLSIINDILDLTKVEAGRYELHDEDIDLDALLRRCLALLRERAGTKGLLLAYRGSGIALRADARALKQIVINLLSNAIKFTGNGGRIELRAAADASGITITVADNGIGMNKDQLTRAMQAFGQVDSALTRASEGTGLGLNVTKALTELHGGRLEIRSAPGKGTAVTVRLPATRLLSAPPSAIPAQSA
ncbi:sensor histidine kinase [Pelagibius marinus]|uniref:sensor histidine kinase n=1 Tax=Pelagibius marinus TaxID=2762760 RepID=UPI001872E5FE|nr:ATP-binding protein [Pelagibius marinus]